MSTSRSDDFPTFGVSGISFTFYSEIAYNDLMAQGKTGNLTYEINGEILDVFIHPDGSFGTVYGRHKFTVEDIRGW